MDVIKVLDKTYYKNYYVEKQLVDASDCGETEPMEMYRAYNNNGDYIGDPESARYYCEDKGVIPEKKRDSVNICSIGFNEKEQKWYGWSHRAMYGFGIGDSVEKGDCAYTPVDKDDYLDEIVNFWHDKEYHIITWGEHGEEYERYYEYEDVVDTATSAPTGELTHGEEIIGKLQQGVWVYSEYNDQVPNAKLRNTTNKRFSEYPEFGRGIWTAKTIEDAKQMAIDFSDGVS